MLVELSARNLALLEQASLSFGDGLNVLTGETGAGKSLVLGALEFLLGEKPRGGMLRTGEEEALVEGRFVLSSGTDAAREWLRENLPEAVDEEGDELELVLSRKLMKTGRTRAHVNHRPVTQRALRELAGRLVEIHGQNEHQRLLDTGEQRRLLDEFGELAPLLADYRARRTNWTELSERVREWQEERATRLDRLDLLRYQVGELGEANLVAEEEQELTAERDRLRYAEELQGQLGAALSALFVDEGSAVDRAKKAEHTVSNWEERIPELSGTAEGLRESVAWLEQAENGLRAFLDTEIGRAHV